jgi:signal transduction histidine kinase
MRGFLKTNLDGEFDKSQAIWQGISALAAQTGRTVDKNRVTLPFENRTLLFTNHAIDGSGYRQISFTDVTERAGLIARIEEIKTGETERQEKLKAVISDVERVEKSKEVLRLKRDIHDTLSQRISVLYWILENPDRQGELRKLKELISSAGTEIANKKADGESLLSELVSSYALIGVTLRITGSVPENAGKAKLLAEIIRECSSNAVRHGGATEINVTVADTGGRTRMTITNNGAPSERISEGSGIAGIRRALFEAGGSLTVTPAPVFTVAADLIRRALRGSRKC